MPLRGLVTFTAPSRLRAEASEAPLSRFLNERSVYLVTLPSGFYLQIYSLDIEYPVPLAHVLVAVYLGVKCSSK